MSWIAWLFLLAGLYLLIVLARGVLQFVAWCVDEYMAKPEELRHQEKESPQRATEDRPETGSERRDSSVGHGARKEVRRGPARNAREVRSPSGISRLWKCMKAKLFTRRYECWVEMALSEADLAIKVEYLSNALALNPTYAPAWGMKGCALLELGRYEEAMRCFDESLKLRPSALTRYKIGLCCFHLKMRNEAAEYFDNVMKECIGLNRPLWEDASGMKKLMEEAAT